MNIYLVSRERNSGWYDLTFPDGRVAKDVPPDRAMLIANSHHLPLLVLKRGEQTYVGPSI